MAITAINLSSLDGSNGFRLDGVAAGDSSGLVRNAGDVNGDGFDDVIVGAQRADPNGEESGSSYVVFGKATGFDAAMDLSSLDGNNGFRLDGVTAYGFSSGLSAGDVNGDGFDDVIVNALADPNGDSYLVFGKATGFDATMDLSSLDGSNGFRLDAVAVDDSEASIGINSAGDVNGDGFADLIASAADADPNGISHAGSSWVVFGKASGFDATLELSKLDGSNGFRLDGSAAGDLSGMSAGSGGDVNGDGFDDVLVGAFGADNYSGASYVVFGKATGFDATMDLSDLDGSNGFRLNGEAEGDLAFGIGNAGDVNGDGFADVIVGAYAANREAGASYVIFGKAAGFNASMDLSRLDGSNGFRLDGGRGDQSGSVSGAGDVNGDGFDDVIVGAPKDDSNDNNSGSSYVVFGKASGFDAAIDLSSLDSNSGFRLDGAEAEDRSGSSVSGAGDVNSDGFDDVIVGAYGADPRGDLSGSSYVVFGRSSFTNDDAIQGTPGNDKLTGTSAAETFEADDGNDKMIGRGGEDVFHGGAGDDYIQVTDLSFGSVDGDSGNDVLHTDGKDLNLDLANFGDKIHGIETICLYGRGDNELTLSAQDLLNLSDIDTLRVNGNAGDHITVVDDGWVDEGPRGSGYYHVYTNDDAVLLVGMNVTIDFA